MIASTVTLLAAADGDRADSLERLKYHHPGLRVDAHG
jgi:hypothetical protein